MLQLTSELAERTRELAERTRELADTQTLATFLERKLWMAEMRLAEDRGIPQHGWVGYLDPENDRPWFYHAETREHIFSDPFKRDIQELDYSAYFSRNVD